MANTGLASSGRTTSFLRRTFLFRQGGLLFAAKIVHLLSIALTTGRREFLPMPAGSQAWERYKQQQRTNFNYETNISPHVFIAICTCDYGTN